MSPKLIVCQRQLGENKYFRGLTKEMQKSNQSYNQEHETYKDQDGHYYCKTCKEKASSDQFLWNKPEVYWRLDEIRIRDENQFPSLEIDRGLDSWLLQLPSLPIRVEHTQRN